MLQCGHQNKDIIWRMYETGDHSDLTLKCCDKEFKVHKAVLCGHSKVFERMVKGDFQEAKDGTIELPEDSTIVVEYALVYMYADNEGRVNKFYPNEPFGGFLPKVYAFADKYDIASLSAFCLNEYRTLISPWRTHGKHIDKEIVEESYNHFLDSVHAVYNLTPDVNRGMRDIVTAYMEKHGKRIIQRSTEDIRNLSLKVLKEVPGFAYDFSVRILLAELRPNRDTCLTCGEQYDSILVYGVQSFFLCTACRNLSQKDYSQKFSEQ